MKYPVLVLFESDWLVYAASEVSQLKSASVELIDKFVNARVIDSNGNEFIIAKAYRTGWATKLWGYNLLFSRRTATIDFEIRKTSKSEFDLFKNEIIERLDKEYDTHFYFDLSNDEMKELVERTRTFKGLINIFVMGE